MFRARSNRFTWPAVRCAKWVWVPQTGLIGIGISILSYNGRVHFGLIADGKLIPDLRAVTRRLGAEFDKLLYRALISNWEVGLDSERAETLLPAET